MAHQLLDAVGITNAEVQSLLSRCQAYSKSDLRSNAAGSMALLLTLSSKQRVKTLLTTHPQLLCVPLDAWLSCKQTRVVCREGGSVAPLVAGARSCRVMLVMQLYNTTSQSNTPCLHAAIACGMLEPPFKSALRVW